MKVEDLLWNDNSFLSWLWFEVKPVEYVEEQDNNKSQNISEELSQNNIITSNEVEINSEKEQTNLNDFKQDFNNRNLENENKKKLVSNEKSKFNKNNNSNKYKNNNSISNNRKNFNQNKNYNSNIQIYNNSTKSTTQSSNSNNLNSNYNTKQPNNFQNKNNFNYSNYKNNNYKNNFNTTQDSTSTIDIKNKEKEQIVKKEYKPKISDTLIKKQEVFINNLISVKELSEKMWIWLAELLKKFLQNKMMVNINSSIDFDTACIIWEEFWIKMSLINAWLSVDDLIEWNIESILQDDQKNDNSIERSPIVAIMWHVDHWKTTLLDFLRKTSIAKWEAGWITQSIWASQIIHNSKKITFIDTPWHEHFTSLRARWAKITDIAIIVIAADDGIKKQTQEAINHAKDAWVPIIIAITKIDKKDSNIDFVKWQISNIWLVPEDRWWETICIPISAFTWAWIDDLLEMILLQAQMMSLKYNPSRNWIWIILESKKNAKIWISCSLILLSWKIKVWDVILSHDTYWKIKKLTDWTWTEVKEICWWDPWMILWLQELPKPWTIIEVVWSEKEAMNKANQIKIKEKDNTKPLNLINILDKINKWEKTILKIIFKADSSWSLEALKYVTTKIELPENIEIKIIHSDIWEISESDIILAQASWAIILWFNILTKIFLDKKAKTLWISIKNFDIIYELIEFLEKVIKWMIKIEEKEVYIWKMNILWIFYKKWNEMIVWWRVIDWKIINNSFFKIYRNNEIVWNWKLSSLKKEKENVNEIWTWHDCWIKVKITTKILESDILEFFIME